MRASGPDSAVPGEKRKQKKINIDEAEGKSPFSFFLFLSFFDLLVDFVASLCPRTNSCSGGFIFSVGCEAAMLHVKHN